MAAKNLPTCTTHAPVNLRSVYDALQLPGNCSGAPARPGEPQLPTGGKIPPPAGALFVDGVKGNDAAAGTEAAPLKTVERAAELSLSVDSPTIVLRAGVYYLAMFALEVADTDIARVQQAVMSIFLTWIAASMRIGRRMLA